MRCDQDSDIILGDDSHTVVVNAKTPYTGPSETVQSFLRYIRTGKADGTSKLTDELSKLVKEAKEDKRWSVEYMTLEMKEQEWLAEGIAKGMKQGIAQGKAEGIQIGERQTVLEMYSKGFISASQAAEMLKVNQDTFLAMI